MTFKIRIVLMALILLMLLVKLQTQRASSWKSQKHTSDSSQNKQLATSRQEAVAYNGIYTVDATGMQLTSPGSGNYTGNRPSWSPDHSRIAYLRDDQGSPTEPASIWIMNAGGSQNHQVYRGEASKPAWSPDGKQLTFERLVPPTSNGNEKHFLQVCLLELPSRKLRIVLDEPYETAEYPKLSLTWSPDGKWIVYASRRTGEWKLWIMSADGSNPHLLPHQPSGESSAPDWSQRGDRILFVGGGDQTEGENNVGLFTIKPDGQELRHLHLPGFDGQSAAWSPDGTRIVYWAGIQGHEGGVFICDPDGSNRHLIVGPGKRGFEPDW